MQMKMILRRRSKRTKTMLWLILLIALMFIIVYIGLAKPLAFFVAKPTVWVTTFVGKATDTVGTILTSGEQIREENRLLQERIDFLEKQVILGTEQSNFSEDADGIVARVLVRPSANVYGTLLVERVGRGDIREGDNVLSTEGSFLGVVESTTFSFAKVRLSSHPGFSQSLSIERSGLPITLVGMGGGNMRAELPQGADIEQYDVVVDLETQRVVAEIGEVQKDETQAFVRAYARMPVNIFEITRVVIVPQVYVLE